MSTWDLKTLKELDKFMDENEVLYDRRGNAYTHDKINIIVKSFELYGERNDKVKKHHYRFMAVDDECDFDLYTKQEYDDMQNAIEKDKKEIKSFEKLWEF